MACHKAVPQAKHREFLQRTRQARANLFKEKRKHLHPHLSVPAPIETQLLEWNSSTRSLSGNLLNDSIQSSGCEVALRSFRSSLSFQSQVQNPSQDRVDENKQAYLDLLADYLHINSGNANINHSNADPSANQTRVNQQEKSKKRSQLESQGDFVYDLYCSCSTTPPTRLERDTSASFTQDDQCDDDNSPDSNDEHEHDYPEDEVTSDDEQDYI